MPSLSVAPRTLRLWLPLMLASCSLDAEGLGAAQVAVPEQDAAADTTVVEDVVGPLPEARPDVAGDVKGDDAWPEDTSDDGEPCVPEGDLQVCERYAKSCGSFAGEDNCGMKRSVQCGSCKPPDTCGGAGVPNECDWWWPCGWTLRQRIRVVAGAPTEAGYSVAVRLDHASLVNAGRSMTSGDDIRIVHRSGGQWLEVNRVLDPDSQWNRGSTTVWFPVQQALLAGEAGEYVLVAGNPQPGTPPSSEAAVFHFADFFNRPDSTAPAQGWVTWEAPGSDVRVAGQALWFDTDNLNNRPVADHAFPALSGRLELRIGMDWARTSEEGTYRLHMQLGQSVAMEAPPPATDVFSNKGAGPSLLWAGPSDEMAEHEGFGYEVAGVVTQAAIVSGPTSVKAEVSVPDGAFDLYIDGVQVADDAPFSSEQALLDRLRLFTWQVSDGNVQRRAFDWALVRSVVQPEPTVSVGAFEEGRCP